MTMTKDASTSTSVNAAVVRRLAVASVLLLALQGTLLTSFDGVPSGADDPGRATTRGDILDETTKLLFMNNATAAGDYLAANPLGGFKFYVHPLPVGVRTAADISNCLENRGYHKEQSIYPTKEEFLETFCDWSSAICNPKDHTRASQYSTTRLNNNMDAVLARLFTDYHGPLRTFNKTEATITVVPFPAVSNLRCGMYSKGQRDDSANLLLGDNNTHLLQRHDHMFLFMNDRATLSVNKLTSSRPGQLVIPYVNTNAEYQPDELISSMRPSRLERFFAQKDTALAAVFAPRISGNGYARQAFAEKADSFFGNGTIAGKNGTLGGLPVEIVVIQEKRKMVGEARTMRLYRRSIFCPVFRGDTPGQKRFFDAILSGCIPVVMAHYWATKEGNFTSYFAAARGTDLAHTYPWSRGSFGPRHPHMGLDYAQLVVEIDEANCGGVDCLPATLLEWLRDPARLRAKQRRLAEYARLFSHGMGSLNALRHADAVSALLVRARHYLMHEADIKQ